MEYQGTNRVATFEKVKFELFKDSIGKEWPEGHLTKRDVEELRETLAALPFPSRGSVGSAGYDFCSPINIGIRPGESYVMPTGMCCKIQPGWCLVIVPRSGLGFKYGLRLDNTVGIIDSDYYMAENNHILLKLHNPTDKIVVIEKFTRFAQGIFLPFGLTADDNCSDVRSGGFGSTGV